MDTRTYFKWATPLSGAGVLFSGYLSGVSLLTQQCAFSEPCPMFLGYPACYYGFALFLTLLVLSARGLVTKSRSSLALDLNLAVAALGTTFAGYFAVEEIASWLKRGFSTYGLGVSTCVYGAVFFCAILALSIIARASAHEPVPPESGPTRITL